MNHRIVSFMRVSDALNSFNDPSTRGEFLSNIEQF
jgi:hypothetical protein